MPLPLPLTSNTCGEQASGVAGKDIAVRVAVTRNNVVWVSDELLVEMEQCPAGAMEDTITGECSHCRDGEYFQAETQPGAGSQQRGGCADCPAGL